MTSHIKQIEKLEPLLQKLFQAKNIKAKIAVLEGLKEVTKSIQQSSRLQAIWSKLTDEEKFVIASLIVLGQETLAFQSLDNEGDYDELFNDLLKQLKEIERFYGVIGGILGYHLTLLKLMDSNESVEKERDHKTRYLKPQGIDVSSRSLFVDQLILKGISHLPELAEIYPVGGAGDRLMLRDEKKDVLLPAVCLMFCGRTLLEGLFRDLQAREYLYYKLFGKQLQTPVVMMTSLEKNNDAMIRSICEKHRWFGRSPELFFFMIQPLAPAITKEGNWGFTSPLKLLLKPGGHGVIWKIAEDSGAFDWLTKQNRNKAILRQINNPIAGTDNGLLTLFGAGCSHHKSFGFASCERVINASEGMNVLIEKETKEGLDYCISNIEYTEFTKRGIPDAPSSPGSPYSAFPANTNILFANLDAVRQAVKSHPIPGMLVNMKNRAVVMDPQGQLKEIVIGRLESTMQNIADVLQDHFENRISEDEQNALQTFVTYNKRRKTISVTKKSFVPEKGMSETPEESFYDMMLNNRELLHEYCGFELPLLNPPEDYLQSGPSFIALFHPSLGPLYSVIAQKIRKGKLAPQAEIQCEIAELDISELSLQGSLLIYADDIMGETQSGIIRYSNGSGKCELHRVMIKNQGIDFQATQNFWKNQLIRKEFLSIRLKGNAEFFAENVTFVGHFNIEVPDGHRMIAYQENGTIQYHLEKITHPTWFWQYSLNKDQQIILHKKMS